MTEHLAERAAAALPEPVEARVVAVDGPRAVRVSAEHGSVRATVATVGPWVPAVGDRVVVLMGRDAAWVLGVIGPLRAAPATRDGVTAEVDDDALVVRDPRGRVLFVHDAATGRSTVVAEELRFRADDLRLSGRAVTIEGEDSVRIARGEDHLEMDGARTRLEASRFEARAGEASWSVREAILGAETVETAIGRARHAVDAVEVTAGQIIERAKDVFRETEGVTQTRAGRIRMIAEGVFSVLGGRATIKAEEELALMGDKIELG
ncbi:MAG: DUF3540 domain-containing protein [Sandaracinaceae bacterium]|nr:DUF3540 domain-containing protein [Sandaracinaceae bacterium]